MATSEMPVPPGHPFYVALEDLLKKHQFDDFVERRCAQFYAPRMGRPSLEPGVYFRLLRISKAWVRSEESRGGRLTRWRCASFWD